MALRPSALRAPADRPASAAPTRAAAPARAPGAGLTRRERRVKAILLQELRAANGSDVLIGGRRLSDEETERLERTLDVDFIDAQLARMDVEERQMRAAIWPLAGFSVLTAPLAALLYVWSARAIRRRRWIYQALRELSDAEDEGVQLSESLVRADLLIDHLVDQDAAARRAPLHRIRP